VFLCVCVFGEIVNTKEFAADFGQIKEEEKKTKKKKHTQRHWTCENSEKEEEDTRIYYPFKKSSIVRLAAEFAFAPFLLRKSDQSASVEGQRDYFARG